MKKTFSPLAVDDRFVVQDFILPLRHLEKAVQLSHNVAHIYPLWLVPTK